MTNNPGDDNTPSAAGAAAQSSGSGGSSAEESFFFNIEKIYVKDLSIEVPGAPNIFLAEGIPDINVQLEVKRDDIVEEKNLYHVLLTVTVTATLKDKTVFLVELGQAGVFRIETPRKDELEPLLLIFAPNQLFPYAREAVSAAIARAGFPPVLLQPVNFEALYSERLKQQDQPAGMPGAQEAQ